MESQANPNSANALNLRDATMKHSETYLSKKPSFRCRRENWRTRGDLQQAWTGNQMYNKCWDENQTQDSLVQSEGRNAMLTCFHWNVVNYVSILDKWPLLHAGAILTMKGMISVQKKNMICFLEVLCSLSGSGDWIKNLLFFLSQGCQ